MKLLFLALAAFVTGEMASETASDAVEWKRRQPRRFYRKPRPMTSARRIAKKQYGRQTLGAGRRKKYKRRTGRKFRNIQRDRALSRGQRYRRGRHYRGKQRARLIRRRQELNRQKLKKDRRRFRRGKRGGYRNKKHFRRGGRYGKRFNRQNTIDEGMNRQIDTNYSEETSRKSGSTKGSEKRWNRGNIIDQGDQNGVTLDQGGRFSTAYMKNDEEADKDLISGRSTRYSDKGKNIQKGKDFRQAAKRSGDNYLAARSIKKKKSLVGKRDLEKHDVGKYLAKRKKFRSGTVARRRRNR